MIVRGGHDVRVKTKPKRATRAARQCEGVDKGVFPVLADGSVVYVFVSEGFALLNPRLL